MTTGLMLGLLILNSALLAFGLWRLHALRQMTALLDSELLRLRQLPYDEAPDLERLLGSDERPLIVIDILNPLQVAASNSWFADRFGAVAPPLIRRIVYQEALKMARLQLESRGVEAQVRIIRGD